VITGVVALFLSSLAFLNKRCRDLSVNKLNKPWLKLKQLMDKKKSEREHRAEGEQI